MEYGTISFDTAETTVEVPTRLNTVLISFGVNKTDNLTVKGDQTITSGKVTFERAAGGTNDAVMQYIMAGY
jgi:hypothetical protein